MNQIFLDAGITEQLLENHIHWALGLIAIVYGLVGILAIAIPKSGQKLQYVQAALILIAGMVWLINNVFNDGLANGSLLDFKQSNIQHAWIAVLLITISFCEFVRLRFHTFKWLGYALPTGLAMAGLIFFVHPQHALSQSDMQYLLWYHWLLGGLLILTGCLLVFHRLRQLSLTNLAINVLALILGLQLLAYRHPLNVVAACPAPTKIHHLTIAENGVMPEIETNLCEQLLITNANETPLHVVIGSHAKHVHYGDFEETLLRQNEDTQILLTQAGSYDIHDHLSHDKIAEITIKPEL